MSSRWCAYFHETNPQDYRFLDFYEYRSKQVDFTFSFMNEAYKLRNDLDLIAKDGSKEMKEAVIKMKNIFKGHRETTRNVDVFWKRIELNTELQTQLHNVEVEGTSSLISTSAKTLKTAIGNIDHTIGNINNTLKLSGNQIDNSTLGSVIGCKRACENDKELPSTPPNKVRIFETGYNSDPGLYNGESSSSDSEIVPKSLANIFLEVKNGDDDETDILESVKINKQSNPEQKHISESWTIMNMAVCQNPGILNIFSVTLHKNICHTFV
ncbi:hypothetical protein Glove_8g6 [Diversispora epigaea]|uniref:Uncharacterized protein n=1 Tax=Diversispora epigaea TaxID=1348612 RepID=A0A397JNZ1_9GLOM|nr:hypothetical protein Glove_8g6 [Diversispora epigaea]